MKNNNINYYSIIAVILFIIFLINLLLLIINNKYSYSIEYKLDNYLINEKYDNNKKIYILEINDSDNLYSFVYDHDYEKNKKIVNNIIKYNKDKYECLTLNILDNVNTNTFCKNENDYIDLRILDEKYLDEKKETYNNIDIYANDNYYVWNTRGLTSLKEKKDYNFLSKESYENSLYYELNRYILFADYDSNKTFKKFYIFNTSNNKIEEFKIKYEISFDSYFLGDVNDIIYLFDRNTLSEYAISIKNKIIKKINNKNISKYYDNKWNQIQTSKLEHNKLIFNKNNIYNYLIIDNKLFLNINNKNNNIKITNLNVNNIIKIINSTVYFISGNTVYSYNPIDGTHIVMSSFEWNFNYKNKIFIFN